MAGKYQAYPEYKDCSFPLIKQIPNNWSEQKVKFQLSDCVAGGTPESGNELFWTESGDGTPWVSIADMTRSTLITRTEKDVTDRGIYSKGLKIVPKGSLLYSIFASLGKVSEAGVDLTTNQAILALIQKETLNKAFFRYWLQSMERYLMYYSTSNTQNNLNSEKVGNLPIFIPSHFEQVNIGCFLDHETAKIDTLIDKQQQLIQLLKEKRQAVISHAVTKGLNPNAPMRDSGVEWLGEVPEHWKIWKFRHIAPIITCGIASTPTYVDGSEGVAFLSAQNIRENKLSLHKYNYITHDLHEQLTKYRKPEVGDLLVTRVGAGIGEACVVNIDMEFSIYVSLTHIRVDPAVALNTFVMYFFGSDYCKYLNYQGTVTGGGVGNLNVQNVERYKLPLPNLEEQQKIVNYLDFEGERFSALIKKSELAIKLMQERRTALISAAVTGKIDVRHHVSRPTGNDTSEVSA